MEVWKAPIWVFYNKKNRHICDVLVTDKNGERDLLKDENGHFLFVTREDKKYPVWLDVGDGVGIPDGQLKDEAIEFYLNNSVLEVRI